MEPQAWQENGYSYGRPYVDKPSFDDLPPSALAAVHSSVLVASAVAADWERVESLFEQNWFGPCSCLTGVWGTPHASEVGGDALDNDALSVATFASPVPPPSANAARQRIHALLDPYARLSQLAEPHSNGNGNSNGTSELYGLVHAPVPEPPFPAVLAKPAASPQKPAPVPIRFAPAAGNVDGDDGPLPVALPIDPLVASAATPEPVPQPQDGLGRLLAGFTPDYSSSDATAAGGMHLAPRLGTWADRQYRLLDPVPERGEYGPASASASGHGSAPWSSSYNHRSPDASVDVVGSRVAAKVGCGNGGSGGSGGSGGCGSGDYSGGGGSSSNCGASQVPAATSPTLLALVHRQQLAEAAAGYPTGSNGTVLGPGAELEDPLEGRRRAGSEAAVLKALQAAGGICNGNYRPPHGQPGPAAPEDVSAGQLQHQQQRRASAFADVNSEAVQATAEAVMQEAAWRWRFTRRWQAEQARTGTDHASSAPPDQLEEALAYLQATNANATVSMQIAQAGGGAGGGGANAGRRGAGASLEGSLALQSLMGTLGAATSTLGGDWPLGACGSGSGSFTSGPRILGRQVSGEMMTASREVASLNRRAALVLQQQMDCEQQAERRVQESLGQGTPWVGQYIPAVQIDEWGSFRFLMLKLRDQTSRGSVAPGPGIGPGSERLRILIRGHNYGSEGQLMEECNREILGLVQKHDVPFEAPTVMGGGVMEWRRDRDRHLHLHSGFVMDRALPLAAAGLAGVGVGVGAPAHGGRPASAMDLLNLAAALARQSFPPTYKITVLA